MNEPRVLRPLGYGEMFNEAFDLYKRNFLLFVGIGAIVFIPFAFLTALTRESALWNGLTGLLVLVPSLAATGAVAKAIADRYLGKDVTIGSAWSFMRGRLLVFLLTSLVAGLILMGGLLLLIIPGIYLAIRYSLLTGVVIVEEKSFRAAFQRCRDLASGNYLRLLVVGVLVGLISGGPGAFLQGLVEGMKTAGPELFSPPVWVAVAWVTTVVAGIVNAVVHPLASLLQMIVYFDLRVRKEGFDIELLAREMGEAPPVGAVVYS